MKMRRVFTNRTKPNENGVKEIAFEIDVMRTNRPLELVSIQNIINFYEARNHMSRNNCSVSFLLALHYTFDVLFGLLRPV